MKKEDKLMQKTKDHPKNHASSKFLDLDEEFCSYQDLIKTLSTSALKFLRVKGINNLKLLMSLTTKQLIKWRNWGWSNKTIAEIENIQEIVKNSMSPIVEHAQNPYYQASSNISPIKTYAKNPAKGPHEKLGHCIEDSILPIIDENSTPSVSLRIKPFSSEEKGFKSDHEMKIQDDSLYDQSIIASLSIRAHEVLKRLRVNNLKDFLSLSSAQLLRTKNCGRKMVKEILRMQVILQNHLDFIKKFDNIKKDNSIDFHTIELGLSVRACNVLAQLKINDVNDFLNLSKEYLFRAKNCGRKSVNEILNLQKSMRGILDLQDRQGETFSEKFEPLIFTHSEEETLSYQAVVETLSYRAFNVLKSNGIDDLEKFMSLTKLQMLKWRNCGHKTVNEINDVKQKIQKSMRGILDLQGRQGETFSEKFEPLIFTHSEEENLFYQAVVERLSYRAFNVLNSNGIDDLEKFMSLTKFQMLKWRNCGRKTVNEINDVKQKIQKSMRMAIKNDESLFNETYFKTFFSVSPVKKQGTIENHTPVNPDNPYPSLNGWISSVCRSENECKIFMLRKGMMSMPPMTLAKIGGLFDLTRERVRQIETIVNRKATKKFQQFRIKPLIERIQSVVEERGGKMSKKELVNSVLVRGEDGDKLRYATPFIDFLSTLDLWKASALQLDEHGNVFTMGAITLINRISLVIVRLARDNADEMLTEDLWRINCNLLKQCITKWHNNVYGSASLMDLSDLILNDSLLRVKDKVRRKKDRIYSLDLWNLQYANLVVAVETALQLSKSPMHFSLVYKKMKKFRSLRGGSSVHNIHATLDRCENALLWDRGTFIHKNNITIPYDLIKDIEQWLEIKLKEDIPFVSVYGPFRYFEKRCIEGGISSESALYTCLREAANPSFVYPHYPYTYLKQNYIHRLPLLMTIEQFFQEAGGRVPYSEFKNFALNGLCIKEFQMNQVTAQLSNVIRIAGGDFLHIDYLKLDEVRLRMITHYARESAAKEGHISVKKIYDDKIIDCKMAGIYSPEMLYSIFQLFAEDDFLLPNYPQILPPEGGQESDKKGIFKQFIAYIKDKEGPCSYQELEEYFVDKLGYDGKSFFHLIYQEDIYRYLQSCLIHKETIGWNDIKQNQLEQIASKIYTQAVAAGRCYALINDLLELQNLPILTKNIYWTASLLADLLISRGNFKILGNGRNAYVVSSNEFDIETFEDLIYELLKREYGGAANLATFENNIRAIGIIKKNLTASMLGDSKKVCIIGKEILLTELIKNA